MFHTFLILVIFIVLTSFCSVNSDNYSYIDLPINHLPFYFNNFKQLAEKCKNDDECEYRKILLAPDYNKKSCWGYEPYCVEENYYSVPHCYGDHIGYVPTKAAQIQTFFVQADFGYIREQAKELTVICEPLFSTDSSLECSQYLRFCRGRNIFFNFTDLIHRKEPIRYNTDVLKQGQIGGYCKFYQERLEKELTQMSALQSWAPELRFFEKFDERPMDAQRCDIIIDKPTYIMKIDSTMNMYHHFCDFFNLYASLHVNLSHPSAFDTDNQILIWETFDYISPFSETFKAFTRNPVLDLKAVRGNTVCFKNIVLPLLPRMVFGLFYNTPIITGCEKSGLFHAFSEHVLHRLGIEQNPRRGSKRLRVTFLARRSMYRKILNEDLLFEELQKDDRYDAQKVDFDKGVRFSDQLRIIRNSDILIGIHGAGLTHLLFLPKWAAIFELYNCEDPNCYRDLARMRGVYYVTWENPEKLMQEDEGHHPEGGRHAKFTNYAFDPEEFGRLVSKAADHVLGNQEFHDFAAKRRGDDDIEANYEEEEIDLPIPEGDKHESIDANSKKDEL